MHSEWFGEMGRILSLLPDYGRAYSALGQLYLRFLDEVTSSSDILLAGTFAKTDYLLKEKEAGLPLKRSVGRMRIRLTRHTETQRPETFMEDFRALCFFISCVYDVDVPEGLLLPQDNMHSSPGEETVSHTGLASGDARIDNADSGVQKALPLYFRIRVISWNNRIICATAEEEGVCNSDGLVEILYSASESNYGYDHSYLAAFLHEGMMLNVINPRRCEDGTILPVFIIMEPDYLVDVSTVAACYVSYTASPLISLLRRLEPQAITEDILMGNMAGELLDSVTHTELDPAGDTVSQLRKEYVCATKRFFQSNATGVVLVSPGREFHCRAWQQMLNIHKAIHETLPGHLERYDRLKVIVEPTFFSEMLGLQGRMDMLQTDMRVLVEQKSGQAAFPYSSDSGQPPRHKEQHYVQMLLYMAIIRYNYREVYERNNGELHAFLLYSKYALPLVGLGFAPDLLFSALKMRNLYVAQEEQLCRDGARMLLTLKPEDINPTDKGGRLWLQYQRPRIESVLKPLQCASVLEQEYFLRFFRFVSLEHRLSKVGSQIKENSGFAGAWLSSLQEKLQCGSIIVDMDIDVQKGKGCLSRQVSEISLLHNGDSGNFRKGDIVVLYPYQADSIPDMRCTMVHRATIVSMESGRMVVRLRHRQTDSLLFEKDKDTRWCIEHDFMESSYSGLYRGLHAFICSPKDRRDLILMQRSPRVSAGAALKGDYGMFNELQLRVKRAQDLYLIIGPPGTGKTSFGMYDTLCEELLEEGTRILVVSYTNRAVDEICSKLYPDIDFIRIGGSDSASELYASNCLTNIVSGISSAVELRERIRKARVLVGTTASVTTHLPLLAQGRFSLCIVDEAGQILEPHLLPLLSQCGEDGTPCIGKIVMIGDHKQLPAVVQQRQSESLVYSDILKGIGLTDCRISMFERLLHRYRHDSSVCSMLTHQGRMHRDISRFPSQAFYEGALCEVPLSHQLCPSSVSRVSFIDVQSFHSSVSDKENIAEAEVIVDRLIEIWKTEGDAFDPTDTVGVIVPYRNQISVIRQLLAERLSDNTGDCAKEASAPSHPLLQITIDTVERFQGSQRRYIIYGLTVQYRYQLRFLTETTFREDNYIIDRKLNVAITRAKEYLLLVGNRKLIGSVPIYSRLLDYISSLDSQ